MLGVFDRPAGLSRGRVGPFTFQVHSGLKTFPEAAGGAVFPADLIDDAVVSPRAQVVVLACEEKRRGGGGRWEIC